MYLLGTLHASGDAAEMIFKKPNPANPTLRGTATLPPKANGKPRYKFLPVQIVDRPLQITKNPSPASNKVLALQLTNVGYRMFPALVPPLRLEWLSCVTADRDWVL